MIVDLGARRPGSIGDRLLSALERRGHEIGAAPAGPVDVLFFCADTGRGAGPRSVSAPAGIRRLVVTRLGTHRDARDPLLRACWEWEEAARAQGPTLTLRLGPLLGPASPLWLRLRSAPRLPRGGQKLLNPVAEEDVVETLDRALAGTGAWAGWYEVAGPETVSLAELADLARSSAPGESPGAGAWEPPLAEMEEHRLAEAGPWLARFGLEPAPLAVRARAWGESRAGSAA